MEGFYELLRDARSISVSWTGGAEAIDPGSGPRNSPLKTKMGENELAATQIGVLSVSQAPSRFQSTDLKSETVPFSIIVF